MDGLMEFKTDDGAVVVVEGIEDESGARLVSREDGPARAARTFEGALGGVRAAAESALRVFRDGSLRPDAVELEFGVKLTAESGAIIAKGAAEGHLVVRLSWTPGQSGPASLAEPGQIASAPEAAQGRTGPAAEAAPRQTTPAPETAPGQTGPVPAALPGQTGPAPETAPRQTGPAPETAPRQTGPVPAALPGQTTPAPEAPAQ